MLTTLEQEQLDSDFKWLMRYEAGRRLAYALLDRAGLFRTTAACGVLSNPAMDMAFAEGRKDIGYRVMKLIDTSCPEKYSLMMKEHKQWMIKTSKLKADK